MDLATGIGLLGGFGVVFTLIMIDGGNFAAFFDKHADQKIAHSAILLAPLYLSVICSANPAAAQLITESSF